MPTVELIPLNKGHPIILDNTTVTTIGRTSNIGCSDNKISRNHAQLFIKSDGTVWIKSIHHNPTFYKTKTNQIVSLTKDKEYQLYNDDQFGLLPDEYFYRVSIKSKDEDQNPTISSSTTSKSPIKEKETLTIENHEEEEEEEKSEPISNQTWMSGSLSSTATDKKEQSQVETTSIPSVNKQIDLEGKKTKEIVYGDDDDEPTTTTSTTEQATASNHTDTTANHPTSSSSTVVRPSKRERCPYGTSCYRTNPIHRQQAIHPGDSDWDTDDDEEDNIKPVCPYGDECYRTNPDHFTEYQHPKKRSVEMKTKQRSTKRNAVEYDDDDDDDDSTNESDDEEDDEDNDDDIEWKPRKKSRYLDDTDDDSTDESDKELAKQEAAEFIKGSTTDRHGPVIKKPRADDE